jgi:exopolyphosphatase/guanosine-5'-triphosphate,3'-diphosphate pyrophosphatase
MPKSRGAQLNEGDLLAAVDLGSNSFHMVVARYEQGVPRVIDRLRETVRLAAGLRADGTLDTEHRRHALQCLARFGQRIAGLPAQQVRAVSTNTVRQLRAPLSFLRPGERALGHAIEVISGREEARLIWQGVAHALPASRERRLVMDVGGGSSEFIIGHGLKPELTESVQIGCVASTLRFFPNGRITRKRWQRATEEIGLLLQQFAAEYREANWKEAWGTSGTVRAIASIANAMGSQERGIHLAALRKMRDALIRAGSARQAMLPELARERIPVIPGGIAILEAAFAALDIEELLVSDSALREGLLWEMIGRATGHDPRAKSVRALAHRYRVDARQAARVQRVALQLFDAVAPHWRLGDEARAWLLWAVQTHELGLAIAHSQHHRHAGYILRHSDLPGFSNEEQQLLAAIVQNHRRKPDADLLSSLPARLHQPVRRITALLRVAVLLCRARDGVVLAPRRISAQGDTLKLGLPKSWRRRHPLTLADLESERTSLRELIIKLVLGHA